MEVVELYIKDQIRSGAWKQKTAKGFRTQFEMLIEFRGDDAGIDMTKAEAHEVRDMLLAIPQYSRLKPELKAMTLRELMVSGIEPKLELATVNRQLIGYDGMYNWAVEREMTDKNPFSGMAKKVKKKGTKRDPFSPAQMQVILRTMEAFPNPLVRKEYQRWGTLIAAYTGARSREIAQLRLSDVVTKEGIKCFAFMEDDDENEDEDLPVGYVRRTLKNAASERTVPIHSRLIELGLLEYVDSCKAMGVDRILHDSGDGGDNGPGRNLGRWFNNHFLVKTHIKTKRLVFHSFRHTVIGSLFRQRVSDPAVQRIVGHTLNGVTRGNFTAFKHFASRKQYGIRYFDFNSKNRLPSLSHASLANKLRQCFFSVERSISFFEMPKLNLNRSRYYL